MKHLSFLAFFLTLFFQSSFAEATDNSDVILSPTTKRPIQVNQGETFSALVNMRLPLTPPPGVQQPAAKTGWSAALTRTDTIATNFANAILRYPATIVRYRPDNADVYRVTIETNPWTPPGYYDLSLAAPGLEAVAVHAVIIGTNQPKEMGAQRIEQTSQNTATLHNNSRSIATLSLDIIVPENIPGFEVKSNGESLSPEFVAWAGDPPNGNTARRVLHFEIDVPGTSDESPGTKTVTWTKVKQSRCSASIDIAGNHGEIDPTEHTPLTFHTENFESSFFAWDFGDGAKATGQKTNHLFMLSASVNIRAFGFDNFGRVCPASASTKVAMPLTRTGCNCNTPGQSKKSVWFYLLDWL